MLSSKASVQLAGTRLTVGHDSSCTSARKLALRQRHATTAMKAKKPRDTKAAAQAFTQEEEAIGAYLDQG